MTPDAPDPGAGAVTGKADQERWERILAAFHGALERDSVERQAFLNEACGADRELWAEVSSLLAAHEAGGPVDRLFERFAIPSPSPGTGAAPGVDAEAPGAGTAEGRVAGRRIGRYRVLRGIGRGGMGEVYLAEREGEGFRQRVALKLVRGGMDSEEGRRRFLVERQALARLSHPKIARFLDGGVDDEERPYFVMEYVEGAPIHRYCDGRRLGVRDRLLLFAAVCEAVQYAHQNLVIHRDLKPGNILVTADGRPKLLDFGVAKLLEEVPGEPTLTRTGRLPMTPEYASPEQVRGEGITTSSDVYQLGVILYELLTGHRPYRIVRPLSREIERAVCEEDPEPPSTAVGRTEERQAPGGRVVRIDPATVGEARGTDPGRLRRQLSGDLDTIVLTSIRKEPERRYASPAHLAEDIRRHLDGLPVRARPDTLAYRASKFVRRHRVGVTATGLITLSLLGGAGAAAWQAQRATTERDRARLEAANAGQLVAFLTNLFEVADPGETSGIELTARAVLDQGAVRIRRDMGEQPEVQARMMDVMADVYERLGRYDQALGLAEEALEVRRRTFGPEHLEVARSLNSVGVLRSRTGDAASADSMLRQALAIRSANVGDDHPDIAESLHSLARLHQERGNFPAAESLFVRALDLRRRHLGEEHESVASTLNDLGTLKRELGEFDEAEPLLEEALTLHRKAFGNVHQRVALSLNELALLMNRRGDLDAAEPLYRESLVMARRLYGDDHPRVVTELHNLGRTLANQGKLAEADSVLREALELNSRLDGRRHPSTAVLLSSLSDVLRRRGELEEAERLARESLELRRRIYGEAHPNVVTGLNALALVHHARGDPAAAIPLVRQMVEIEKALPTTRKPHLAVALNNLGVLLHANGECEAAIPFLAEALTLRQELLPSAHWRIADVQSTWGACLTRLGRYDEAEAMLLEGYGVIEGEFGERHPATVRVAGYLADLYDALARPTDAARFRALAVTGNP